MTAMHTPGKTRSKKRLQWAASTVVYVLGGCSAGVILGGLGGRFLTNGVGIDALTDVLGGIGVGVMVGAVLTLGTARRLPPLRRARIGSMLFLLAAIAFSVLFARGRVDEQAQPIPPTIPVTEAPSND